MATSYLSGEIIYQGSRVTRRALLATPYLSGERIYQGCRVAHSRHRALLATLYLSGGRIYLDSGAGAHSVAKHRQQFQFGKRAPISSLVAWHGDVRIWAHGMPVSAHAILCVCGYACGPVIVIAYFGSLACARTCLSPHPHSNFHDLAHEAPCT